MDEVRLIIQLLKQLRVQHSHDEIEAAVVIGNDTVQHGFFLAHAGQLQLIGAGQVSQRLQIEFFQMGYQRDLDGFQRLGAAAAVIAVIFQGNVVGVPHGKALKQLVHRALVIRHILVHIGSAHHLHDHGKVLFFRRRFVVQIQHQRHQEHLRRLVPKRVGGLAVLGGGVLEQVGDKALNVIVVPQIHKWVVAKGRCHVNQIENFDPVALGFQQAACAAELLPLGVQHDKRTAALHEVGQTVEAGLAGAGTAHHNDVQIPHGASAIQPHGDVLGEQGIFFRVPAVPVFPVNGGGVAPFGGTMFLSAAITAFIGQQAAHRRAVHQQKQQDTSGRVLREGDLKWLIQRGGQFRYELRQST